MNDELLDKLVKYPLIYVAGLGKVTNLGGNTKYRENIDYGLNCLCDCSTDHFTMENMHNLRYELLKKRVPKNKKYLFDIFISRNQKKQLIASLDLNSEWYIPLTNELTDDTFGFNIHIQDGEFDTEKIKFAQCPNGDKKDILFATYSE